MFIFFLTQKLSNNLSTAIYLSNCCYVYLVRKKSKCIWKTQVVLNQKEDDTGKPRQSNRVSKGRALINMKTDNANNNNKMKNGSRNVMKLVTKSSSRLSQNNSNPQINRNDTGKSCRLK